MKGLSFVREVLETLSAASLANIVEVLLVVSVAMVVLKATMSVVKIVKFFGRLLKGEQEHVIHLQDEFIRKKAPYPYKMAISKEDIYRYLGEVAKKRPMALMGIEEVRLVNPDKGKFKILGTYEPHGSTNKKGVIKIYPLMYDHKAQKYYMPLHDGSMGVCFSEEEAKELQLFTLGHELGHNVIYRKKGVLAGDKVEKQCDEFSDRLQLVRNPRDFGEFVPLVRGRPAQY